MRTRQNRKRILGRLAMLAASVCVATQVQGAGSTPVTAVGPGRVVSGGISGSEGRAYAVTLDSGTALQARLLQHGIDLAVDVLDPGGLQVTSVDRTGDEEPEIIDLTATESGEYTLVIRAFDPEAGPGRFTLCVDRVLSESENARRLAAAAYPVAALYNLWEESQTDANAVDAFWQPRKHAPVILETIPDDASEMRATFFTLADEDTEYAMYNGGPDFGGLVMRRLGATNLHFITVTVPIDARFRYAFNHYRVERPGEAGAVELRSVVNSGDFVLEMPEAAEQREIERRAGVRSGAVERVSFSSRLLGDERELIIYTPPEASPGEATNLLVVFDGEEYATEPDHGPASEAWVPTPTILDSLLAQEQIEPTVAVFIPSGRNRYALLTDTVFADFVATELIPWMRDHYALPAEAGRTIVAGSSRGGYAAVQVALRHPDVVGNVLSQSGSFWIDDAVLAEESQIGRTLPFRRIRYPMQEEGGMIEAFKRSPRLPIRFYLEVGRFDLGLSMIGSNRRLRDVLQVKGYEVDYWEFSGAHDFLSWRGTFARGLVSLLGSDHGAILDN